MPTGFMDLPLELKAKIYNLSTMYSRTPTIPYDFGAGLCDVSFRIDTCSTSLMLANRQINQESQDPFIGKSPLVMVLGKLDPAPSYIKPQRLSEVLPDWVITSTTLAIIRVECNDLENMLFEVLERRQSIPEHFWRETDHLFDNLPKLQRVLIVASITMDNIETGVKKLSAHNKSQGMDDKENSRRINVAMDWLLAESHDSNPRAVDLDIAIRAPLYYHIETDFRPDRKTEVLRDTVYFQVKPTRGGKYGWHGLDLEMLPQIDKEAWTFSIDYEPTD